MSTKKERPSLFGTVFHLSMVTPIVIGTVVGIVVCVGSIYDTLNNRAEQQSLSPSQDGNVTGNLAQSDPAVVCPIYGREYPEVITGRTSWRLMHSIDDIDSVCKSEIEASIPKFYSQTQSVTHTDSLVQFNENGEQVDYPLWRITKISSISRFPYGAFFSVYLDNDCRYTSVHKTEAGAEEARRGLKSAYGTFFAKNTVGININRPAESTIYVGGKSCMH